MRSRRHSMDGHPIEWLARRLCYKLQFNTEHPRANQIWNQNRKKTPHFGNAYCTRTSHVARQNCFCLRIVNSHERLRVDCNHSFLGYRMPFRHIVCACARGVSRRNRAFCRFFTFLGGEIIFACMLAIPAQRKLKLSVRIRHTSEMHCDPKSSMYNNEARTTRSLPFAK